MTAIEEIRYHAERAKREGGMYYSGEYLDGLVSRVEVEYKAVIYENDKLRELVADMWFWGYCGHMDSKSQEWQMKHIDGVIDRMREL